MSGSKCFRVVLILAGLALAVPGNAASSRQSDQFIQRRVETGRVERERPAPSSPPTLLQRADDGVQVKASRGRLYINNLSEFPVNIYISKNRKQWRSLGVAPAATLSYALVKKGKWWFYGETEILDAEGHYFFWGPGRITMRKKLTIHLQ